MDQLGDYRLLEELAIGTTGRVYAASRTPSLGEHHFFALKVVDHDLARNERFAAALRQGVARLHQLEHPDVVSVLEITQSAHLGLASPLVDGQSLDRVLDRWRELNSRLEPVIALWIVQRLASILNAAHGEGVVHGHLAPDQILVTYDGELRLIGLGLVNARGVLPLSERRRSFLAPEVIRTGVASASSDIHGLARILHHTLAGDASVLGTPGVDAPAWLPPLRSYGVTIHPAVEAMVESMMAPSLPARPPLDDVESTLMSSLGSRGIGVRSQLARLMQTAFTAERAGATLRRQRAGEGADPGGSTPHSDDVPRLQRRTIAEHDTDRRAQPAAELGGHGPQPNPTAKREDLIPESVRMRPPRRIASTYGLTESSSLRDLVATDVFNGAPMRARGGSPTSGRPAPSTSPTSGRPAPSTAPDAVPSSGAVVADDPRLEALESGDDEDLRALVDAIVSHSTPPHGVTPNFGTENGVEARPIHETDLAAPPPPFDPGDSGGMVYPPEDYAHPLVLEPPEPTVPIPIRPAAMDNGADDRGGFVGGGPHPTDRGPATQPLPVPPLASADISRPSAPVPPLASADMPRPPAPVPPLASADIPRARGPSDYNPTEPMIEPPEEGGLPLPEPLPPEAMFSDEVPQLPVGTVIGERYRIEDVIGEGGVSVVYRCSHSFLRKDVAIKVLRPELATMPPVVERFHREARSVAQLDHPNIVRVLDFGKSNTGSLFLVMDLIEGVSLADQIEREGWLAPTSAVRLVASILTGLDHAHGRGVIHRDLKPDNIMIVGADDGTAEVKILDFGIAKLGDVEIGSRPITEAGMVFGTPRYMSPEQAAGEPVDHRSDLFAVGIILYQLLSGQLPFDGETTVQILRRVLTQAAPRLRVSGLPTATSEALADVVDQALAKNPEDRFPSARTMREALQACFPL